MNGNQQLTNNLNMNIKMESENHPPASYASGEPNSKKRKCLIVNEEDNETKRLKAEMVKMKELVEKQQKTIYNQAMTITKLEEVKERSGASDDILIEDPSTKRSEFHKTKTRNAEMKQTIEDEKKKFDAELAKIKSDMSLQILNLEKKNEAKDKKIEELERLLTSIKNIKSEPDCDNEERKLLNDKFRAACDNFGKNIKDLEAQLESEVYTETALRRTIFDLEEDRKQLTKLAYQTNNDNLKVMILESNKKTRELEKIIELKEEDLKDLESRITELDAIYKDVNQQNMDLKEQKCKKLTVECEKKIKDMKAEMQTKVKKERENYKAEIDKLKDTVDEINKKLNKASQDAKEMKAEMQSKFDKQKEIYKKETDRLKDTVDKLTESLCDEEKAVIQRDQKIKEMKYAIQSKDKRKECKPEMDKLKVTVDELNKKVSEKQKSVIQQLIEIQKLKDKITVFEENQAKLRSKIEELEQNEHEANEIIADQQKRIEDFESGFKPAKNEPGLKYITLDEIYGDSIPPQDHLQSSCNNIILKVSRISLTNGSLEVFSVSSKESVNFKLLDYFTNTCFQFHIDGELELNSILFYMIMPRIYSCNLTKLNLNGATIAYEMFEKLVSSHTITSFKNVRVQNRNDKRLGYDQILKELPKIEIFEMDEADSLETSELCQNLTELPPLQYLQQFKLKTVDPSFDLETFGIFIKKNCDCEFYLQYSHLTKYEETIVAKSEEQMRRNLPSNCKVFLAY